MLDINYLKQNGVDVDKSLELFGDLETYNETFQDYLDGIAEKLTELKKYKDLNDMANYAVYAHSIKSDARYLGFTEVAKVALDHEMAGKNGDEHFIAKEYQNLVDVTNKMTDIVKNYLGGEVSQADTKPQTETTAIPNDNASSNEITEKTDIILVADDSKLVTNFVLKALGDKYQVVVASDGQQVINLVNDNKYHIISLLLDLNMPNVGGFEVLDYFKTHNLFSSIPVSIITGEDSKDMINKAFTYGIVDMLVKPFMEKDVVRVVEKTVNFLNN
jgi:CheY-like chemotaxis protein/HPt (histidine-containing phosphotransfer) domain-containing protein